MKTTHYRGIRPDDLQGRMGLRNPERGFRTEMYAGTIPGDIGGLCSVHSKEMKLDGRSTKPAYVNRLIRGNRLDASEFQHWQWQDELDALAYDGVTMMQSYIYLMAYADGRDLSAEKLADIQAFFAAVRRRRVKVLLRFAYELRPRIIGPTGETILRHLDTLKPLLRDNSDVIYALQCGFIGVFGEWHDSLHHLEQDIGLHRDLFAAVLDALPPERMTMVRQPLHKTRVYGAEPVTEERAFSQAPEARIGHFNDGFLAGPTHGGTFRDEPYGNPGNPYFDLVTAEARYLPVDGELFWNDLGGEVNPLSAAALLHRHSYTTFGMVHGHSLFQGDPFSMDLWRQVPVDLGALRDRGMPLSDGYSFAADGKPLLRSYYEYCRDHLGYRLELQSGAWPESTPAGGAISCTFDVINRGFSSPINPRPVLLSLTGGDGCRVALPFAADVRRWFPSAVGEGTPLVHTLSLQDVQLPNCLLPGTYDVGLWLPDAAPSLREIPEYAIRFANPIPFRNGVNVLGQVVLT